MNHLNSKNQFYNIIEIKKNKRENGYPTTIVISDELSFFLLEYVCFV
jgi:hypothetical protein